MAAVVVAQVIVAWIIYELVVFSPVLIFMFLYIKRPRFRRAFNRAMKITGNLVWTFIVKYF